MPEFRGFRRQGPGRDHLSTIVVERLDLLEITPLDGLVARNDHHFIRLMVDRIVQPQRVAFHAAFFIQHFRMNEGEVPSQLRRQRFAEFNIIRFANSHPSPVMSQFAIQVMPRLQGRNGIQHGDISYVPSMVLQHQVKAAHVFVVRSQAFGILPVSP